MPASVTSIGEGAFKNCDNLTIRCYAESTAHKYAIDNSINYVLISTSSENIENNGTTSENDTEETTQTEKETSETTSGANQNSGCGSAIGGAISIIAVVGIAVAFVGKKKEEQ